MAIEKTPLYFEIDRIINSDFYPAFKSYFARLKLEDRMINVIKIMSIDEHDDYELSYGSVVQMQIVVMLGDYSHYIYPNRDKLELELKIEGRNHKDLTALDTEGSVDVLMYNVALSSEARPYMSEDNSNETIAYEVQNLMDLVFLDIQLKPKLLDDIAKVRCGGQFLNSTTADVVRNAISLHCAEMEIDDDEKLLGVDIHHSASQDVQPTVVIEHGTNLYDLADIMQKRAGGVFPTGMAQFIKDKIWYVYPPYDTQGYDEAREKVVLISVPAKRFPFLDKTYITEGGITTVLCTGAKAVQSDKHQLQDTYGNGAIYSDARQMVSGFAKEKGNVVLAKRSENNAEFVSEESHDNKNNLRKIGEGITANPYLSTTRLARAQGHFYTLEWQNCDTDLLKPGLNIKIMYIDQDEVREINGVLLKCHKHTMLNGVGLAATGHRTNAALVVFVKSEIEQDNSSIGLD